MVIVDGLLDLIIDNNLIVFISNVKEDAVVVAALCLPHKILAVLDCSEEDSQPGAEMGESLHRRTGTMTASAADYYSA